MLEAFGELFGGLGLFFLGMRLLTENLKTLTNYQHRRLAASWAPNRFAALGWGVFAGSVTQNMSALTFIAVSMLRANLLTTERAIPLILGANIGTVLLVLFVSLDIELAALYALGFATALVVSQRTIRVRPIGAGLLGVALMFVGLAMVKEAAAPLTAQPWFDEYLEWMARSLWLSFLGAVVLTFLVQSSSAVMVFAVGMAAVGVLNADQVIMCMYGSFIGSGLILFALSWRMTGISQRVVMFQVLYNVLTCAIFIPIFYLELLADVPLLKAVVLAIDLDLDKQMALMLLLIAVLAPVPFVLFLTVTVRLLSLLWPATTAESLSRVEYIHDRGYGTVSTALRLVALEQRRVLSAFSLYLDAARQGVAIDSLRGSLRPLLGEIDDFLAEVGIRHPGHAAEDLNSMLTQQRLITWLEEQLAELCTRINQLPDQASSGQLRTNLVEGVDAVVLVITEALTDQDAESWSIARRLTADRGEPLTGIRRAYMEDAGDPDQTVRSNIFEVTNTAGEIFFLLSRLTQEMEDSPALGAAAGAGVAQETETAG